MRKLLVALSILICSAEAQGIGISIIGSKAEPGGMAEFVVSLSGIQAGGVPVNNAQLDILFDTSVFYVPADARQACQVSPYLAPLVHTETLPRSPAAPVGMQRLRLNVIDTIEPLGDIGDGDFYFCALEVREDAPAGNTTLAATRQNVGDTAGNVLPCSVRDGVVLISGSGSADALQPRGGAAGVAPPVALEIPAQAPGSASDRPAQPVESGKTGRIGSVAVQGMTPGLAAAAEATPPALDAGGADLGARGQVGERATVSPRGTAAQDGTPGVTPSPESTKGVTPQVTNTKAATPVAKTTKTVKAEETPAEKKGWGGCSMGRQGSLSGAGLVIVAAIVVWLLRRKTA